MFSPLKTALKSLMPRKSFTGGADGSVSRKNAASESKVLPTGMVYGRKNTPCRKMLNELKNENDSKFAPNVSACLPRNRVKLLVSCHTS
jgi:hypothetical protein